MPSKRSVDKRKSGLLESWLQTYVDEENDAAKDKSFRLTQAGLVSHELALWNVIQQVARIFVAFFVYVGMLGLALNQDNVDNGSKILLLGAINWGLRLLRSVIAGGPSADVMTFLIAPVWTTLRAGKGNRLHFMIRSVVVNLVYAGTALAASYAAACALTSQIATSIVLTLADVSGSHTILNVVLGFAVMSFVVVEWCDTLGLGDMDGAWLPRSSCKENTTREQRDYHRQAVLSTVFFFLLNLTTGLVTPVDLAYIFATWTQTTAANAYGDMFLWMMVSGVITLVVLGMLTFFDSEMLLEWSLSLSRRGKHPERRFSERRSADRYEEPNKVDSSDDDDDDD